MSPNLLSDRARNIILGKLVSIRHPQRCLPLVSFLQSITHPRLNNDTCLSLRLGSVYSVWELTLQRPRGGPGHLVGRCYGAEESPGICMWGTWILESITMLLLMLLLTVREEDNIRRAEHHPFGLDSFYISYVQN